MTIKSNSYCILIFSIFIIAASCSSSDQGFSNLFPASKPSNYFKISESVTVEVYYEPGAEPYEGNIGVSTPLWNITRDNITEIFSYKTTSPDIFVPEALSEMIELSPQNRTSWSVDNVINLYKNNHMLKPTSTSAVFYIYFLNGFSSSGSNIIGFSINDTPVIAIFKDVIENSSTNNGVRRFVEQSTIVHELGHAFGLVNNGIPLSSSHQDSEHGAHTLNEDCIMFWLNEGASDLRNFVQTFITTGETRMWGPEVLADVEAFSD